MTELPYDLISIQVDGGSEFRDEFEKSCETWGIPLFVLPPRKPKWNGCVERDHAERSQSTTQYEFYTFYETLNAINQKLAEYQHFYNHYRPHDGIGLETPMSSSTTHTGGLICLTGTEPGQILYFFLSALILPVRDGANHRLIRG